MWCHKEEAAHGGDGWDLNPRVHTPLFWPVHSGDSGLAASLRSTSRPMHVKQFWECIWPLWKPIWLLLVQEVTAIVHLTTDNIGISLIFTQFQSICFKDIHINSTSSTSYLSLKCYGGKYTAIQLMCLLFFSWAGTKAFKPMSFQSNTGNSLYSPYYPKSGTGFHSALSQLSRKLKQFNHLLSGCPNRSEKHSFFTSLKHALLNELSKQTQILQWGITTWQPGCIREHTSRHH